MTKRADELIRLLYLAPSYVDPNPGRDHITGLEHALRVATLAYRHDREDPHTPFVGLIHDLARPLSDIYHGEVMAEIVRDIVTHDNYMILKTHGNNREVFMNSTPAKDLHPWWPRARALQAWEDASFAQPWNAHIPVMTIAEARSLIHLVCGDRA